MIVSLIFKGGHGWAGNQTFSISQWATIIAHWLQWCKEHQYDALDDEAKRNFIKIRLPHEITNSDLIFSIVVCKWMSLGGKLAEEG